MFPSWWSDKDLLLVIDCGIDESGTKSKNETLLVVSGHVGKTSNIKRLSSKWNADLERFSGSERESGERLTGKRFLKGAFSVDWRVETQ